MAATSSNYISLYNDSCIRRKIGSFWFGYEPRALSGANFDILDISFRLSHCIDIFVNNE